jgi:hypothetical protein
MNSKYVWKYRQAMLERGARIALAHWGCKQINGEFIEVCHMNTWFTRNIGRYGYWSQGIHVKQSDMAQVQSKFWSDVFAILEDRFEVGG